MFRDSESLDETTPLSHQRRQSSNNNNNNIVITQPNGNRKGLQMDDTKKRIIVSVTIDLVMLALVGFPILFFFLWGDPYKRGFFCDDESLMHPFHESTVQSWMLYIIGIIVPLIVIISTELVRAHVKEFTKPLRLFDKDIPYWAVQAYKQIGVFGFGAACSQLATDIGKYSIGRLRPHFFSVCQPIMENGTTCLDEINKGKYIENFRCSDSESSARMLKEMRLSFPSGHSSFSTYTMIFCAIYLHARMNWRGSKLLKHFLQFIMIMLTWYTCLSRISDYKHHWSDVLAGATLGSITALIVANFCTDLFDVSRKTSPLPATRYELSSPNHVTSNGNQ